VLFQCGDLRRRVIEVLGLRGLQPANRPRADLFRPNERDDGIPSYPSEFAEALVGLLVTLLCQRQARLEQCGYLVGLLVLLGRGLRTRRRDGEDRRAEESVSGVPPPDCSVMVRRLSRPLMAGKRFSVRAPEDRLPPMGL
jgi:hypothetical protein